jgi:predicted glycosyltransferase
MNIIIYCQYVWGMGHLIRSLEFARALSVHNVTLVAGGQEVAVDVPRHVRLMKLPVLYMDEKFTTLIPGDSTKSVDEVRQARKDILYQLFKSEQPDILIVELYPFGRSIFGFELEPLLADIRSGVFGAVKTVCSLRDILVEKKDPAAYEQRVIKKLNQFFDVLLVHADRRLLPLDATFSRVNDIAIPVVYTGFIAQQADRAAGEDLRQKLEISGDQKLIVASAGGGRSGYRLLDCVIRACEILCNRIPLRLEVFAGPFMQDEAFNLLAARASGDIRIRRFTKRLLDYLSAADLSISLAGYNTCMNLLVSQAPALVYPYSRQREQPMRVDKIKDFFPMRVLTEEDMQPDRLSRQMLDMLQINRALQPVPIDLNGAANAAEFLSRWVK